MSSLATDQRNIVFPLNAIMDIMLSVNPDMNALYKNKSELSDLYKLIISSELLTSMEKNVLKWYYQEGYRMYQIADIFGKHQSHLSRTKRNALNKIYNTYGSEILEIIQK